MTIAAVDNLRRCFTSLGRLLDDLAEDEWGVQSLCPAWSVQGVVAHLVGIEAALSGWRPVGDEPAPFDTIPPFMADAVAWPPARLLERYHEVTSARSAELAELGPDAFAATSWTPVGVQTYGRFMEIRVFDFWVHEQDVRVPLGRAGHLSGPAAEMALDEVRRSWGYIMGRRVGLADGQSALVHLTGTVEATLGAVAVDGRARPSDDVTAPTAELTTDFLTFMLLCCGRIDPGVPLGDGRVRVAGEPEFAGRLARQLAFTF